MYLDIIFKCELVSFQPRLQIVPKPKLEQVLSSLLR